MAIRMGVVEGVNGSAQMSVDSTLIVLSSPFFALSIAVAIVNWWLVFRTPAQGAPNVSLFPVFCPALWFFGAQISNNDLLWSLCWVGLIIDPASLGGIILRLIVRRR